MLRVRIPSVARMGFNLARARTTAKNDIVAIIKAQFISDDNGRKIFEDYGLVVVCTNPLT